MLGHYRPAIEPPFKWRFAGEPLMTLLSDIWILSPLASPSLKNVARVELDPL